MYAIRPYQNSQVCVKQQVNGYEISIAFDDSCGALQNLERGDIRVYRISDDKDITEDIDKDTIRANIENMKMVYDWCMNN